jgi:hypothetical protein
MQTRARVTSRSRFVAKRRSGNAIDILTSCPVFTSNTTANGSLTFSGHTVNSDTFTMTMVGDGTIVSVNGNPVNNTTYNGIIPNTNTNFVINVPLNSNYVLDISSSRSINVTCAGDGPRPAANIAFSCPSSGTFDGFDISEGTFTFTSHTNTDTFTLNMTGGTISTINGIPVNSNTYAGNVIGSVIPFTIEVPIDTNYTLDLTTSKGANFNCAGTGGVSTPPNIITSGGDLSGNNLSFPDTVINTTSSPLTFNVSGTFVNFPITIVSNSPRFIVDTPSIPAPIGGNLSATLIGVTFNPTAIQVYNSTITITCGPTVEIINLDGSGIGVCALSNMVGGTSPHSIAFAFNTPPAFNTGTVGLKRTNQINFANQTITNSSSPHQFAGILSNTDYDWKTTIDCGGSPVIQQSDPIIHTEVIPCEYGLSGNIEAVFSTSALFNIQYPTNSNSIQGRWYVDGTINFNNFTLNSPTTSYTVNFGNLLPSGTKINIEFWDACNVTVDKNTLYFYTGQQDYFLFGILAAYSVMVQGTPAFGTGWYPTIINLIDNDTNTILETFNMGDLFVLSSPPSHFSLYKSNIASLVKDTSYEAFGLNNYDNYYGTFKYKLTTARYNALKNKNLKIVYKGWKNGNSLDTSFTLANSNIFSIDMNSPFCVSTPIKFVYDGSLPFTFN